MRSLTSLLLILLLSPLLAAEKEEFELHGRIRLPGDESPGDNRPVVLLEGATHPFSRHTFANRVGDFKFEDLRPALYRLIIAIPGWGEMERTVRVSPALADENGRVRLEWEFETSRKLESTATVSASRLSIPDEAVDLLEEAEDKLGDEKSQEARRLLNRAVEIAPNYAAAWNRLGTMAYLEGDYSRAYEYFQKALESDPSAYAPLVNLGAVYLSLGNTDEALRTNEEAVQTRPEDPLARSQLGQTLFVLNRFEQAEKQLRMAVSLDPGHFSFPQLVLAEIYRRQERWGELVTVLESFLERHPDVFNRSHLEQVLKLARERIEGAAPPDSAP